MTLSWPWWTYSILASILWGVHFNLIVKVSSILPRDIYTPLTLFFITASSIWLAVPIAHQKIFSNLHTIWHAEPQIRISAILLVFTTIIAATLLNSAMQLSSNATLASLLDITYPVFVALVAWLVFREGTFDWTILVGGTLIFSGAMLIIWKHG